VRFEMMKMLALVSAVLMSMGSARASDFNGFKTGCVATQDTTLVVPVIYGTDFYSADSLSIAVITLEYDGTIARFRSVEAARPGWQFLAINDNQHVPECAVAPPLRRLTFIVDGNLDCNNQASNEILAYVRFGMVSRGTTVLRMVPTCSDGRNMNHGSNCTGSYLMLPDFLYDGCAAFAHVPTDVDGQAFPTGWSFVKRLYR
jgi:hypothetical protein